MLNIFRLIFITSLSTLLSANSLSSFSIGASNTSLHIEKENTGYYSGIDVFQELKNFSGFGLGFGADINIFPTQMDGISYGNSAYTMATQLKVGYSFNPKFAIPLRLKASYGYGVSRIVNENGWGTQYDLAIEYNIYSNYGVAYKYKSANANLNIGNIDIKSSIVYLSIIF